MARGLEGRSLGRRSRVAPCQPAQRKPERVELRSRFRGSPERVEQRLTTGHGDGVEPALDLQVLDQSALAEQSLHLGGSPCFGRGTDPTRRAASALPDRVLQRRLAPAEVAHVPPCDRFLLDAGDDAP